MKKVLLNMLFLFIFSFGNSQGVFKMKGRIEKSSTSKVWIYNYNKSISDTLKLNVFKKFSFSKKLENDELIYIKPLDCPSAIVINAQGNTKIKFKTSLPDIHQNLVISGDNVNSSASEFFNLMSQYSYRISEAENKLFKNETADGQYYYDSVVTAIKKDAYEYKKQFIIDNFGKVDLLAVNDFMDYESDYEALLELKKGLKENYSKTDVFHQVETAIFKQEMSSKKVNKIGDEVPILLLPGLNGIDISTASLSGNYILIDFWASWCKPCRKEHPGLIKLYEQYKKKGFEIYSISLDNSKQKWENAIVKDQLSWDNHVSNLKMFKCPSVNIFNIRAIPYNVLVDKEGKVIDFNLKGKKLEDKLKQLLDEKN